MEDHRDHNMVGRNQFPPSEVPLSLDSRDIAFGLKILIPILSLQYEAKSERTK